MKNEYLSLSTHGAFIHLPVVFGVVAKERRLAGTYSDHLAVDWAVIAALAEELPTQNISAQKRRGSCLRLSQNGKYLNKLETHQSELVVDSSFQMPLRFHFDFVMGPW